MSLDNKPENVRELNIIISISQNIIGTLDYVKVLQIISDGMAELLDIESSAIYMLEGENELFLSATTPPLDPAMPDSLRRASVSDHPHIQRALSTCSAQFIKDTLKEQLSPAESVVIELRQLRSLLYLPFVFKKKASGVLILGTCNKSRAFSEQEIRLGQTLANQLSMAINNAKLHVELKQYNDNLEKEVGERTKELEALNEELKTMNDELHEKNEIVYQQKEELLNTLNHLKETQSRLIESEKMASLGVLTAGIAHEINNPLNFIMGSYLGLNEFFKNDAPQFRDEVDILLTGLKIGVERASDIVRGLNLFNRVSETYDEICDIPVIINNCLAILNNKYKHTINIEKEFADDSVVKGNVGKLHQVFMNILMNAIQAIHDKGTISIKTVRDDGFLISDISDNGCGISPENLSRITDPFFTTKSPGEGTGLGLSITYNIVRDHNGAMSFESAVDRGTTVRVSLPINREG